jgi:hypothetical protein
MGENLDDYQITPSDLGQDPENDPGVVEEAIASGSEKKQPISPCFKAIPFEAQKGYRKLWDGFEVKDMPFEDFAIEMHFTSSPLLLQRDLARITDEKQQGYRRMAANLHDIKKNLN